MCGLLFSRRVISVTGLLFFCVSLGGCLDSSITFPVSRDLQVLTDDLGIPEEFTVIVGSGVQVPELPCTSAAQCPDAIITSVACNVNGFCDPDPFTATLAIRDVDLGEFTETRFATVETVSLRGAEYVVLTNTFTGDLPALTAYWGPMGASGIDPVMGVQRLGSIPSIAAGTTTEVPAEMELDAAGAAALSDHLSNTSSQFRVFIEATVDVDPGDAVPLGELAARVQLQVTASGRLL